MEILHIAGWLKNFNNTDRDSCGDLPRCVKPHPVSLLKNRDIPGFARKKSEWQRALYIPLWTDQERKRAHLTMKVFWVTNNCWRKKKSPVDLYKEAWRHTPDLEFSNAKTKRKFQQRALRHPWKQTLQVPPCGLTWVDAGSTQTRAATSPIAILAPPLKDPPTHEPVQQQWFESAGCYKIGFNCLQDQDANDNSALVPIPLLIDDGNKTNPIAMTSVILSTLPSMYMRKNRTDLPLQPKPFTSCLTDGMWSTHTTECEALSFDEANCQARVLQAIVMERRRNCNPEKHLKQQTMKCNLRKNDEDTKLLSLITIAGKFSCCYAMLCYAMMMIIRETLLLQTSRNPVVSRSSNSCSSSPPLLL